MKRHGSYGRAQYDYGPSGYGPSGGSRGSSRHSSPSRSTDRVGKSEESRHGQSGSISDHTVSIATERTRRQGSDPGVSEKSHGQSTEPHNQSGSSISRSQRHSRGNSAVTEGYGYRSLSSSTTTWSRGRQESGSSVLGNIRGYSQHMDDKWARDSEARGYHGRERTGSGSFYLASNTPLYEYAQAHKFYYFQQ